MDEVSDSLIIKNSLYFPLLFFFIGVEREVIEEMGSNGSIQDGIWMIIFVGKAWEFTSESSAF